MLHKETVNAATLELIKDLQSDLHFKDFLLVGGTFKPESADAKNAAKASIVINFASEKKWNQTAASEFCNYHFLKVFIQKRH